jgi:hypothetical protein
MLKQNPQIVATRLLALESDRQRKIALSVLLPQASLTAIGLLSQYNVASTSEQTCAARLVYFRRSRLGRPIRNRCLIAGAAGSRQALLPPQNATGNFIKVLQRIRPGHRKRNPESIVDQRATAGPTG